MSQIITLLLIALTIASIDVWRYRHGRRTFSTIVRSEEGLEPSVAWLIGAGMTAACVYMAWGQPLLPWFSGYLSGGLMWGLMVHFTEYKH